MTQSLNGLLEEAFNAGKAAGILEERKMFCVSDEMIEHNYEPRIRAFYDKLGELKERANGK